jgi:formamidopyrimidine-DNA glycosylase
MPELPEVETVRLGLARHILGGLIESVAVPGRRTVRRQTTAIFSAALLGRRIERADRHGKYLVLQLSGGPSLVAHLRMSGQLLLSRTPNEPAPRHTQAVIGLSQVPELAELRFVDPRTFGELFVSFEEGANGRPVEIAALGIDALDPGLDGPFLSRLAAGTRRSLKQVLTDQHLIAGIGNIYADEICFRAAIAPSRAVRDLSAEELARVATTVVSTLTEAVVCGGSSLRDGGYRDLFGALGRYQGFHMVYGKEHEPCRRCGSAIERIRLGGRSSFSCATCQH